MIFYIIILIMLLVNQLSKKSIFQTKVYVNYLLSIMFILLAAVIILNPYTDDMERYLRVFQQISDMKWFESLTSVRWEPGFMTYQWILSRLTKSNVVFILITAIIIWSIILFAVKKIIPYKDLPLVMFGFLSLFSFYNFSRNIIRQGIAVPLLFAMMIYLEQNNYKKALVYFGLAISFHISAVIGFVLFIIKKLKLSIKFLISIYISSVIFMVTDLNQKIMSVIAAIVGGNIAEIIARYSSEAIISRYGAVNRIDFLVFTTVWIVLGIWFNSKYMNDDVLYEWLVKSYIGFSIIYILFGFIGYSDRLAAYAWFFIPIIVFYPVIKMKSKYRLFWMTTGITINIILFIFFDVINLYKPISLLSLLGAVE